LLLGDTSTLHVRVDIDENDGWRLKPGMPAKAFLRGNSGISFDLSFAYTEPYVLPKIELSGASTERVDTRVLQVVYSVRKGDLPICRPTGRHLHRNAIDHDGTLRVRRRPCHRARRKLEHPNGGDGGTNPPGDDAHFPQICHFSCSTSPQAQAAGSRANQRSQ
jgi:hypothetical protein